MENIVYTIFLKVKIMYIMASQLKKFLLISLLQVFSSKNVISKELKCALKLWKFGVLYKSVGWVQILVKI